MKIDIFFNRKNFFVIFLFLFSIIINQYYGYRGVFPIDSFIIFESGFNVISGNHPFKDYWTITGPFLDYIQSAFFLAFGINWFSYVLHASIINLVLALFSFYFFRSIGLKIIYAFIYSLAISILAYPSAGTPFMDHHAVIFSVMALYSLMLGIFFEKNLFWFLTSIFLIFSFLSKQIPSAYLLILFTVIIFYYFSFIKDSNKKNLLYLFYGIFLSLIIITSIFFINEIPIKNFLIQYIFYPLTLGDARINALDVDFKNLISQFKFIYFSLIPMLISLYFLIKIKVKNIIQKKELLISILFIGSIIIFIYCQLLTKNQVLIFFLIPICAALSNFYAIKYFNKNYIIYFILIIFIFSTFKYHIRFNQNKKFMELVNADFSLSVNAGKIDKKLSKLKWISPNYINDPLKEVNLLIDTKNILSQNNMKRKIIITNYQFFSGILGNQYTSPNKWYDHLSVPSKKNKYYSEYKNFFLTKIKNNNIGYIYTIGKNKENFFMDLINDNECVVFKKLNELLVEFKIDECEF